MSLTFLIYYHKINVSIKQTYFGLDHLFPLRSHRMYQTKYVYIRMILEVLKKVIHRNEGTGSTHASTTNTILTTF